MWSRRQVLAGMGASLAAGGLGLPGSARASFTTTNYGYNVLEIFLAGGLSHRETLWVAEPGTASVSSSATTFPVTDVSWSAMLQNNINGDPYDTHTLGDVLELDCGALVSAAAAPLATSTDINAVTQMMCLGHDLPPHEAATYYAATGTTFGRGKMSGMAAAMERQFGGGSSPVAFVLDYNTPTHVPAFLTTGLHGAAYRPIVIPVGNTEFESYLDGRADVADGDALLNLYRDDYRGRLVHGMVSPTRLRSKHYDTYAASLAGMQQWSGLAAAIDGFTSSTYGDGTLAWSGAKRPDHSVGGLGIEFAAHLIANHGARYVAVVDRGLGNLDTHDADDPDDHPAPHHRTVWSVLHHVRQLVDAGTLDLDETIVVIHSEFGRIRVNLDDDDNLGGTEHHHVGYPAMLIGGPVRTSQHTSGQLITNPAVFGGLHAMTESGGTWSGGAAYGGIDGASTSDAGFTPTDLRAYLYLCAGIDPFVSELLDLDLSSSSETDPALASQALETRMFT